MAAWEAPVIRAEACALSWPLAAAAAIALCLAGHVPPARAAGYAVGQESVSGMGIAYSGGAATGDVSSAYYNPAAMTRINGRQLMFGGSAILPFVEYDEQASVLFDGTSYAGGDGGDGGQNALVPHFYGIYPMNNGLRLGLSFNSPFGLVTNYSEGWKGRYSEVTTSLKSFNLNPSIAGEVLPGLSVGAGVSVQYLRGKLRQNIDFGSNCVQIFNAADCVNNFGLIAGQTDGDGKVRGNTVGYGYNVGLLYELNERTRIGAHYRSRMVFNFDGTGKFIASPGAHAFLTAIGIPNSFGITDAKFNLVEPEQASVSVHHEFNDKWAAMADVTWTRWAVFDFLRIEFADQTPDNFLLTKWDNVFRYSLGATYKWKPDVILRGGLAFDDSPINGDFRGPGIPDSDRIVLAFGVGYAVNDNIWVDAGYQHLFFKTGNTRRLSATNSVLNGDFDVDVDVFGMSFTVNW